MNFPDKKIKNNFLTGHLGMASSKSISANGAEIFINNIPVQQSFQKWFYFLLCLNLESYSEPCQTYKVWFLPVNYLRKTIHP